MAFEDMPDRLPVNTRGFHGHVRDAVTREPVQQAQQIPRRGPERLHPTDHPAACCEPCAGDHRILVDVESGGPAVQYLHASTSSSGFTEGADEAPSHSEIYTARSRQQSWVLGGPRVKLRDGLAGTNPQTDLAASTNANIPAPATRFISLGRR